MIDVLQVAALCGVHCVNTLLQGPYFTEVELAQASLGTDGKCFELDMDLQH